MWLVTLTRRESRPLSLLFFYFSSLLLKSYL